MTIITDQPTKPLGRKAYGSIPHLLGSRRGPSDAGVNSGQHRICTERTRDAHDQIIVSLKLDGSNVAVANVAGALVALTRAGYRAVDSPYEQHHRFAAYVAMRQMVFRSLLQPGEYMSGEWLAQAHGTRYDLTHRDPFVAFDLWQDGQRVSYADFRQRVEDAGVVFAPLLHIGGPCTIATAMERADARLYGEVDMPEGAVWRVERHGVVDFLAKYVRPEKIDGCYLDSLTGQPPVWNWQGEAQP